MILTFLPSFQHELRRSSTSIFFPLWYMLTILQMWVSTRVEDKLVAMEAAGEETDPSDAYERALEEVISEDNGQTWAVGQ
jgi:hypothetical protein